MSVQTVPHLNFHGEARAALAFYQSVFGGEQTLVTYGQFHQAQTPAEEELLIWGQVAAPSGFKVMAFDATTRLPFDKGTNAYYVAARFSADDEAYATWAKLKDGASIRQDLGPAPWGALYGMLEDKFGVVWIVDVEAAHG